MAKPENIEPKQLKEATLNGGAVGKVFPFTYAKCVKVVVKVSDGSDGAVDLQTYLENLRQKIDEMGGGSIDIDMEEYPTYDDMKKALDKAKEDMADDMADKAKEAVNDLVDKGDIIDRDSADDRYLQKGDAERDFATKEEMERRPTQTDVLDMIREAMDGYTPGELNLEPYLTKAEAASTYQPIGNYLTEEALNGKGYVTSSTLDSYATKDYVESKNYLTKTVADGYYAPKSEFDTLKTTVEGWSSNMTSVTNLLSKFDTSFTGAANSVLFCNASGKITSSSAFTYNDTLVSAPGFQEN